MPPGTLLSFERPPVEVIRRVCLGGPWKPHKANIGIRASGFRGYL